VGLVGGAGEGLEERFAFGGGGGAGSGVGVDGAEHVVEDGIGVGERGRLDALAGAEDGEELEGDVEIGAPLLVVEGFIDDSKRADEEVAEAGGGGVPEFIVAAIEFGDEVGVVVFPAGESGAGEIEGGGDGGQGSAHDQEGEGGELLGR
jgi:hypothetical protein